MPHKRNKCCFAGCSNSQAKYPDLHFYKFPVKRQEVCEAWLFNCANEDLDDLTYQSLANKVVCGQHFTKDDFTNHSRTRLTLTAVPTLLSFNDEQSKDQSTEIPAAPVSTREHCDNLPAGESNTSSPQCSCKFPTGQRVLHTWVAATGKPNFVPNDFSKICRLHFVESDYIRPKLLKAGAVPTKNLGTKSKQTSSNNEESIKECNKIVEAPINTLSTILNPQSDMNKVQVLQQHHGVTVPSATCIPATVMRGPQLSHLVVPNGNLLFSIGQNIAGNPIQLNPIPLSVPVSLVQVQGMAGVGQHAQLVTVQPTQTYALQSSSITQQTHSVTSVVTTKTITSHSDCSLGAIKVVDVNKLLQPTAKEREEERLPVNPIQITVSPSKNEEKLSSPEGVNSPLIEPSKDPSNITVSHVLNCLKAILPNNFDLSRLVHNEKVSKLIIRYLKLADCVRSQTVIKSHLEIIIRASKSEIKVFGDFDKHPYFKIKPLALQVALAQLLPTGYYMGEVTDSLLNCLCVILNQHIYTDGFTILREKITKFSKNFGLNDQVELVKKQNSTDEEKTKTVENDSENEVFIVEEPCVSKSNDDESKDTHDIQLAKEYASPLEESDNTDGSKKCRKVTVKRRSYYVGTEDDHVNDPNYEPDFSDEPKVTSNVKTEARKNKSQKSKSSIFEESTDPSAYFRDILDYLKTKNCTAQDVLVSFKLMFHLCRYLNIKSKQSNLVKLKAILRAIIEKNISLSNVEHFQNQTIKQKKLPVIDGPLGAIDKLKMKPVVVLKKTNLFTDYNDECYYASKNKQLPKHKINHRNYDERISPLKQIDSTLKYTSEHVRKVTDESYKMFRRIILKKKNNRAIFRLKYKDLQPGQKVFVKDFHRVWIGYLQGTINRRYGPISYSVILESGEKRNCTVDHLRPVFGQEPVYSPRTQRLIKPKQLFDL